MDSGLWQSSATNQALENPACETDVRNFRRCMDENQGNMTICGWYLDQLVRFPLLHPIIHLFSSSYLSHIHVLHERESILTNL